MANHETNWILRFIDQITKPLQTPTKATKELSDTVDKVTASIHKMDDASGDASKSSLKDFDRLKDGVNETEQEVEELKKDIDGLGDVPNTDGIKNSFTEIFRDLKVQFADIFNSLQTGNIGGIEATFQAIHAGLAGITRAAWAFIATPIGAAIAALAGIGLVAADFVKYNKAAREANIITQQITNTVGEALGNVRIRAQVIEQTFGQDFKRTLEVAQNNVQAFGISWDEAFDQIEDGLIRGGMANDEFFDSMREYPRLFANAGFTMEEFQRTVNTGLDLGIYADKLPDAVKEFGLSINEQTESSRAALERAFGTKFTNSLFDNISRGSITAKDALKLIAEETERVGVNATDAAVLTADLFRGAGEDAGGFTTIIEAMNTVLNETPAALTSIETHLDQVADANLRLAEAKREALESDSYHAFAQEMEIFWTEIKIGYYNFIAWIQRAFSGLTRFLAQLLGALVSVPTTIKDTFLNITEDLGMLVDTVMSAGKIIDDALHFRWGDAKEGFKNFKSDLSEDLRTLGKDIALAPAQMKMNAIKAFVETGENIDMGREIAAYYRKQELENSLKKSGGTTKTGGIIDPGGEPQGNLGTRASSLSGSGGQALQMELTVNNYFNVKDGADIMSRADEIIDMVVGGINSRVKDGLIAATA